jgi:hypothetical protein
MEENLSVERSTASHHIRSIYRRTMQAWRITGGDRAGD